MQDIDTTKRKINAAKTSVAVSFTLAVLKIVIYIFSGSIAVMASALDSAMDSLVSFGNLFAIHKASKPADRDHSYGHGKIEAIASLIQAFIIASVAIFLCVKSVKKFFNPTDISNVVPAILVMCISVVGSFFLSNFLNKEAKKTDSPALRADLLHYSTDFWTNLSVIFSLVLFYFTKFFWIDSLMGLLLSVYILYSTIALFKESFAILTDREMPKKFRNQIVLKIKDFHPKIKSFHDLKTRQSGTQKFIDFHLVFDKKISLASAHKIADKLIDKIENEMQNTSVFVHFDICDDRKR